MPHHPHLLWVSALLLAAACNGGTGATGGEDSDTEDSIEPINPTDEKYDYNEPYAVKQCGYYGTCEPRVYPGEPLNIHHMDRNYVYTDINGAGSNELIRWVRAAELDAAKSLDAAPWSEWYFVWMGRDSLYATHNGMTSPWDTYETAVPLAPGDYVIHLAATPPWGKPIEGSGGGPYEGMTFPPTFLDGVAATCTTQYDGYLLAGSTIEPEDLCTLPKNAPQHFDVSTMRLVHILDPAAD